MLKGGCRVLVLFLAGVVAAPAAFAGGAPAPTKAKHKAKKDASAASVNTKGAPAQAQKRLSPEQIRISNEGVGQGIGEWVPMPGLDGTPGLFTIDSGVTLPKGGLAVDGYVHRYGRAPGSLTITDVGWNWGIGLTNRLTVFGGWDVHRHIHVGSLNELSTYYCPFNTIAPPGTSCKPTYPGTILPTPFNGPPDFLGNRAVYSEDFPFAYENNGGIGPVDVGVKFGILSELRGDPVSLAVRDEAFIPTHMYPALLKEGGVQSGAFSDLVGLDLSKTFADVVTWSFDWGHLFTRDPRSGAQHLVTLADQEQLGTGFLFFPDWRFQPMTEYDGVIYDGAATPDVTFGPRDPMEGMWGFRVYPWHSVSVDAGYTYMMNLPELKDRDGFIIKLNTEYWPSKPVPPDNVTVTSTADPHTVQQCSGQPVQLTATGTDTFNHNLTYTWTAPAGTIKGAGANVPWDAGCIDPGQYTLAVRAEDPYGNFATSSQTITVTPKPIPPPTMACEAAQASVLPGARDAITATVQDQSGTTLNYTWRTTGGTIVGTGSSVELDTTGLAPGTYTVTGRVENGKGQAADCNVEVTVQAPPPPKPQASKIDQCLFKGNSTRVDNVCKRVLDNVALRLQSETGAHVVVIGYASAGKTARAQRLAERRAADRAENAKKYLVSKGISEDRIETRTGTPEAGATVQDSNRIDIIWVPEGATY